MTAQDIISNISQRGITLELVDEKIRLHGTEDVLDQTTISLVKTHKLEIISHLAKGNIQKISFPMSEQDLIEFKRLAESGVQFDFPEENPGIPSWSQIVPSSTDKEGAVHPVPCYCCGGQSFWRKKDNAGGRWICKICHPPVLSKDEIVYLQ